MSDQPSISYYRAVDCWNAATPGFALFVEVNGEVQQVREAAHMTFGTEEEALDYARMLVADATDEEWEDFRNAQADGYGGTFDEWLEWRAERAEDLGIPPQGLRRRHGNGWERF